MVIDSSIIIAILLEEAEAANYLRRILASKTRLMSTASYLECGIKMVYDRGELGLPGLELFVLRSKIELVPVDVEQATVAIGAFEKYGKGRHKAALNFGDCFSYALAKVRNEPLFYQGNDFFHSDLA